MKELTITKDTGVMTDNDFVDDDEIFHVFDDVYDSLFGNEFNVGTNFKELNSAPVRDNCSIVFTVDGTEYILTLTKED